MYRFFAERDRIEGDSVRLSGEDVRHIRQVLRMRTGERLLLSCGDEWEYTCEITSFEEDCVVCRILDAQKAGRELASRICLYQCLPKGDKMETVIQKAVELGACQIFGVRSRRCVVRLDEKKEKSRLARWNAIAESAAKQAKRMVIPEVPAILDFEEALSHARASSDICLMPYEMAEGMEETRRLLEGIRPGDSVSVLIGPEGGFDEREAELARAAGFHIISLGRRILRTETAGMTVLSILMYLLETDS